MTDETKVLTDPDAEESPPEKSDPAQPEESGEVAATPEEQVGAGEGEEALEEEKPEEEKKLEPFHTHPDWQQMKDKERLAEDEAHQRKLEAEYWKAKALEAQKTPTTPKEPEKRHTRDELQKMVDDGEMTYLAAVDILQRQNLETTETQRLEKQRKAEADARALKMVPGLSQAGSPEALLFAELAATRYRDLFQDDGEPTVPTANEIVAEAVKNRLDGQRKKESDKAAEEQRLRGIESQNTRTTAPDGRGGDEPVGNSIGKLDEGEKGYILKRDGVLTEKAAKEYLESKKLSTPRRWPEKAVRR